MEFERVLTIVIILVAIIVGLITIASGSKEAAEEEVEEAKRGTCTLPSIVCTLGKYLGIPAGWLVPEKFLRLTIAPAMGVAAIVFGFLHEVLRIFKRASINLVITLAILFTVLYSGFFALIVAYIFNAMGMYAVLVFMFLFFAGISFFARAQYKAWWGGAFEKELGIYETELARIKKEKEDLLKQIDDLKRTAEKYRRAAESGKITLEDAERKRKTIQTTLDQLEKQLKFTEMEEKEVREKAKEASKRK